MYILAKNVFFFVKSQCVNFLVYVRIDTSSIKTRILGAGRHDWLQVNEVQYQERTTYRRQDQIRLELHEESTVWGDSHCWEVRGSWNGGEWLEIPFVVQVFVPQDYVIVFESLFSSCVRYYNLCRDILITWIMHEVVRCKFTLRFSYCFIPHRFRL